MSVSSCSLTFGYHNGTCIQQNQLLCLALTIAEEDAVRDQGILWALMSTESFLCSCTGYDLVHLFSLSTNICLDSLYSSKYTEVNQTKFQESWSAHAKGGWERKIIGTQRDRHSVYCVYE